MQNGWLQALALLVDMKFPFAIAIIGLSVGIGISLAVRRTMLSGERSKKMQVEFELEKMHFSKSLPKPKTVEHDEG